MRKATLLYLVFFFMVVAHVKAQVGIGTQTPDPSAKLEIKSPDKGVLLPRVALTSTSDLTTIKTPAISLLVYNTASTNGANAVKPGFYYWSGSKWVNILGSTSSLNTWSLGGNTGTNPANNFIGTTDYTALKFRVNNIPSGEINAESGNTTFGFNSFSANTYGIDNSAFGKGTLQSNTLGMANTATGVFALANNTTGSKNTATGKDVLFNNTTGNDNTATGHSTLFSNTTGSQNTANGKDALYNNTTGSYNTATGQSSLFSNTTGASNTANGLQSLYNNTTGGDNTATGFQALFSNTTGISNTANGLQALYKNTTGSNNTANGLRALLSNTTGIENTATGKYALFSNTTGNSNTGTGLNALYNNTTGSQNTATGRDALYNNTIGNYNTTFGQSSLFSNTTGTQNTAHGYDALRNNTTGDNNTAIGQSALFTNTTGAFNTAIGFSANTTKDDLRNATAIGAYAKVDCSNCFVLGNDANVGIGTTKPEQKLTVKGNSDNFIASFENTNGDEGDGIQIKLGKTHPAYTGSGWINMPNFLAKLYAKPGQTLKGLILQHAQFDWKQILALYPNTLLIGTGWQIANVVIDSINAKKPKFNIPDIPIPPISTKDVDGWSDWNPAKKPVQKAIGYINSNLPTIPAFPVTFPDLLTFPEIIPADAINIVPNIAFDDANSNSLSNKNKFLSFKDKDNRELGSIRAESVSDWKNNYLSDDFFTKFMMSLVGLDLVNSISWAGIYFTDMSSSYNNLGVEYVSGHGDYAEWLERSNSDELITQGDIVGVKGGKITRNLLNAEQIRVVSTNPIMLGNAPEKNREANGNKIAFMGQVPVKVMGVVHSGDYIVARTDLSGYGKAVSPQNLTVQDLKLAVGRSWENNSNIGAKTVNTLVGIDKADYVKALEGLEAHMAQLEAKFAQLSANVSKHYSAIHHSKK